MSTQTSTATKPKVKVSAYATNVLSTNKALRTECKTLGGALKLLWMFREEIELGERYAKIVHLIRNDKDVYHNFRQNCRVSKAGNYSPFYVLQAIYKMFKQADATENKKSKKNLTPIADKSVKELKALAKKNSIKGYSKMNKAQLVDALTTK
jgi:hypothetical protein